MKVFKYDRWLIFFMLLGLVASLVISMERHRVEEQNRQVDMAIDYEGLLELADREGMPAQEVLAQAKDAGFTSLAVYETNFKKFNENGKASAVPGSALLANYRSGALSDPAWQEFIASGNVNGNEVYVTGEDPQVFQEVKEDLLRRLGEARVASYDVGGREVLAVKAHYETFLKMNLGLPTDEMRAVNEAGFYVIARPSNYEGCTADDVRAVFHRLEGIRVSEVVFSGKQSLGTTKALQATIDEMKSRDLVLGLIEAPSQLQFYEQEGMGEIVKGIGYDRVARLYSIPKDEMPKLKMATAVERWANTDQERNIRIDLLRIYESPSPNMSLLETNMKYFRETANILRERGFTLGPASTFEAYYPSRILRAFVMLGVAAAGALYLSLLFPGLNARPRSQHLLFLLFALLAILPVLMGNGNKIRILAAFAGANLVPALAVIWQLDRVRSLRNEVKISLPKLIGTAAIALFVTGVMSYVGAAYLSGSLSDVEYFLEFNIYRGIKLTFVLPLLLVALAFLQRFDIFDGKFDEGVGMMAQFKHILDTPVKVKTLMGIGVVLLAGIVFIARSGHNLGMPVSGTELRFRAFLEQMFYARPRSKELLIGHPAFMLAAMAWQRKWPTMVFFVLVILATIGQGSMVETFAHMRTPVYMSFVRGIGGILLGAGVGAVAMVLIQLWQTIISAAKRKGVV